MAAEQYDAIIIGAGQAGGPLATTLAKAGYKTAIIEREHVGGTCVNVGCTPTKTMVASARVAYLARRGADYGVQTGAIRVDMEKVRQRKRDIVDQFRGGSERSIQQQAENLDLIRGEASFTSAKTLQVALNEGGTRDLAADLIFINTGGRTAKVDGLDGIPTLTSTTIMELDHVPEHLIVIGGGYIGLEFGQMFRRFGSAVTVIQRGSRLLGREDDDIADEVAKIMHEDGIAVLLDSSVAGAQQSNDGKITIIVQGKDGERQLTGSHVLVAAGRTPNTDRLNLAAAGIHTDKGGYVQVDRKLETNVPGVYALGDVKGGPAFTHISYDDFRIVRTNLVEKGDASTANRFVPYTVFIDPQLGRVGMTEQEARESGRNFRVARMPMSHVARALETDETRGLMKAIVDADTRQILGCAILGIEGGEIASMIQIAMMGNLPYTALKDATFSHPNLSEALNNLFTTLEE
jgi:pyruvate/2-oxoglutarate dehydrogenase complex dihydrolipoamide dehydrogenase (E3) component